MGIRVAERDQTKPNLSEWWAPSSSSSSSLRLRFRSGPLATAGVFLPSLSPARTEDSHPNLLLSCSLLSHCHWRAVLFIRFTRLAQLFALLPLQRPLCCGSGAISRMSAHFRAHFFFPARFDSACWTWRFGGRVVYEEIWGSVIVGRIFRVLSQERVRRMVRSSREWVWIETHWRAARGVWKERSRAVWILRRCWMSSWGRTGIFHWISRRRSGCNSMILRFCQRFCRLSPCACVCYRLLSHALAFANTFYCQTYDLIWSFYEMKVLSFPRNACYCIAALITQPYEEVLENRSSLSGVC